LIFFSPLDFILMIKKSGETRRVVFEEEVADSLIKIHHRSTVGGHSGIVSTYNKLKSSYFWNGMKSDVAEFIAYNCYYVVKTFVKPAILWLIQEFILLQVITKKVCFECSLKFCLKSLLNSMPRSVDMV